MWSRKFLARGFEKSNKDILLGKEQVPAHDTVIDPSSDDGKKALLNQAANNQAYINLIMACYDEVCFGAVDDAKMNDLPDGDVALAWKNLVVKYELKTSMTKIQLKHEFNQSSLEDIEKDPDELIADLEYL